MDPGSESQEGNLGGQLYDLEAGEYDSLGSNLSGNYGGNFSNNCTMDSSGNLTGNCTVDQLLELYLGPKQVSLLANIWLNCAVLSSNRQRQLLGLLLMTSSLLDTLTRYGNYLQHQIHEPRQTRPILGPRCKRHLSKLPFPVWHRQTCVN